MSYLPQLKEEVGTLAKNPKVRIAVAVILVCLVFASGWLLCRHYDAIERTNSNDVITTVRNTQELNRNAQTELDRARTANQSAESANQNAQRAADDITDTNTELSELNRSDADAIDAAERVFRDVDSSNQR